jgi:hypothetical protein
VTIDVREEPTGLAVDIGVPETFRDGDMLVETKGCYLHVTIRYDHKQAHSSHGMISIIHAYFLGKKRVSVCSFQDVSISSSLTLYGPFTSDPT